MYQFGQCIGCSKFIFPINLIGNSCLCLHSFIMLDVVSGGSRGGARGGNAPQKIFLEF